MKQAAATQIMPKAVIYARYSSHTQTEQSIEEQLRVNYEYAERVVEEYDKEFNNANVQELERRSQSWSGMQIKPLSS